jgi:hypothetical protein
MKKLMKLKRRYSPPVPERSLADEIQHMVEYGAVASRKQGPMRAGAEPSAIVKRLARRQAGHLTSRVLAKSFG